MPTFDREYSENCVGAIPFILSRRLARLVTEDVPAPFLYSSIFYFMAGFDRHASKFFIFFAISLVNHYIAVMCAMTCVATVRHFSGASLIANLVFTMQSLACGMFIQSNTIPVYVRWLKWITYTVRLRCSFSITDTDWSSSTHLGATPATSFRAASTIARTRAECPTQPAHSIRAST